MCAIQYTLDYEKKNWLNISCNCDFSFSNDAVSQFIEVYIAF